MEWGGVSLFSKQNAMLYVVSFMGGGVFQKMTKSDGGGRLTYFVIQSDAIYGLDPDVRGARMRRIPCSSHWLGPIVLKLVKTLMVLRSIV